MIEHPPGARRKIGWRARFVEVAVDVEADFFGFPFNGENVKIIGNGFLPE